VTKFPVGISVAAVVARRRGLAATGSRSTRRTAVSARFVAGSLAAAAAMGVGRSILFTGRDNVAARRAYESIGYRRIGDYGLVVL